MFVFTGHSISFFIQFAKAVPLFSTYIYIYLGSYNQVGRHLWCNAPLEIKYTNNSFDTATEPSLTISCRLAYVFRICGWFWDTGVGGAGAPGLKKQYTSIPNINTKEIFSTTMPCMPSCWTALFTQAKGICVKAWPSEWKACPAVVRCVFNFSLCRGRIKSLRWWLETELVNGVRVRHAVPATWAVGDLNGVLCAMLTCNMNKTLGGGGGGGGGKKNILNNELWGR